MFLPQAEAIAKLQEERSQLSYIVEQGLSEQAELNSLRQQATELSGVAQELQQTRQTLLELQAVARQLEQHRTQITCLADQKAELEGALQQQAELTAEVSVLQRDYDEMLDKARRALTLQEELPKLQVGAWALHLAAGQRHSELLGLWWHTAYLQKPLGCFWLLPQRVGARLSALHSSQRMPPAFSVTCGSTHCLVFFSCTSLQASASGLGDLEVEHRKLSQLADKANTLRAQNAQMASEVANLPELKKAAADLQQQVVQMQHVRQQIQRLQVGSNTPAHGCYCTAIWYCCVYSWSSCCALCSWRLTSPDAP